MVSTPKTFAIRTFGCQMNEHDSERLAGLLTADGLVRAEFDEPQRAITPGQSAVFYDGDEVVGGGWIV